MSVCIPVFNGENYISECINSVLKQSYTNFELLILDNCSTDTTPAIIKKIDDSRIHYVQNEINIGAERNFAKCVEQASGEYFLLLPHDDFLLPWGLMQFVSRLEDPTVGFVYSSIRVVDTDGRTMHTKVNHQENRLFTCEETIVDIIEFFMPIQLAMARTDILKRLGGFDPQYGLFSDIHLWLSITFDGWKAFYNSEPLSCHRVHSQQGQIAYHKRNLFVLGHIWGKNLDKTFWIKNSYNYFFLKVLNFILSEMTVHKYNVNRISIRLLKLFARSHLRSLWLALINLNGFIFWQELMLFKQLSKKYGPRKILSYYPLVVLDIAKKKLGDKPILLFMRNT